MTDEKRQPDAANRPEQKKPEQTGDQTPESQVVPASHPTQHVAPGRKPLFHN